MTITALQTPWNSLFNIISILHFRHFLGKSQVVSILLCGHFNSWETVDCFVYYALVTLTLGKVSSLCILRPGRVNSWERVESFLYYILATFNSWKRVESFVYYVLAALTLGK
jgi:hypothetical protein